MAGLAPIFLAALDDALQQQFAAVPDLEGRLHDAVREAVETWPKVALDEALFVRYLAERALAVADPEAPLQGLRVADLYLACGCCHGLPNAIAAFEDVFGADIQAVARRFRSLPADDVMQLVRKKILVPPPDGSAPKIADYAGLGFLQNWVRITAVRTFVDEARRDRSNREMAYDEAMMAIADPDDDVELAYLKRHYRGEFKSAFTAAIESLTSRQRNALRMHLVAGLTIDQIAAVYGIHRATAARRIAAARESLLAATRRTLAARLRIDYDELGSIMRLIRSQLDVSIVRLLHSRSDPGDPG